MNPIAKLFVAALLLTGSAAGMLAPAVNNAPAATPTAVTTAAESTAELTAAEAVAIALDHAGLTQAEVSELRTRRERDDGKPVWDVEFRHGNYEYDYTIHAETGKILERDRDYEPRKETPTQPPATEPPVTEPPVTQPPATEPPAAELTTEEALAIALADAGLTAEEVTNIRSRQERDDGVLEWELEFRCGDYEYDYTIHAKTGKILERDKDYEPPKTPPTQPPATEPPVTEPPAQETTQLTQEEALAIALKHAGLTTDQVDRVRCTLDRDDGVMQWEIEFRCGKYEYDYDIHAETGKILEWDKDRDD